MSGDDRLVDHEKRIMQTCFFDVQTNNTFTYISKRPSTLARRTHASLNWTSYLQPKGSIAPARNVRNKIQTYLDIWVPLGANLLI
jgi:hypothetical protein